MRWMTLFRRNPAFFRMWLAECASLVGDWFSLVAVSILAAEKGGGEGALAVAVTLAAYELPCAAMRPVAGVLADRFDRRNVLITVHVIQALLTAVMAQRALARDVFALQALVFIRSVVAGMDWPARNGAIRRLVVEQDRLAANALGGASWSAMYAVGMALGGFVTTLGVPVALTIDAVTFAFAALLLTTLPALPTRGAEAGFRGALAKARDDFVEGTRIARSSVDRFRAVASKTPLALVSGAGVVLLNVFAQRSAFAGSPALTLGILQATRGIGTGLGPLLAAYAIERGFRLQHARRVAGVFGIVGLAMLGLSSGSWWCLLPVWLWGMGVGSNWMISSAELQRHSDDEAIGRLSGLDLLSVETSFALSALAGAWAIESTGMPGSAAAVGAALGALGFLAVFLGVRGVARRSGLASLTRA
jgi:MFS family permease